MDVCTGACSMWWVYTITTRCTGLFNQGWVTMCLGLISPQNRASLVLPAFFLVWYHDVIVRKCSFSDSGSPDTSCSAMHGSHACYYGCYWTCETYVGMTKDCGAQMRIEVKTEDQALISAITFCPQSHSIFSYCLAKPDSCFSCKSLALQDYNNKALDDELATVPC